MEENVQPDSKSKGSRFKHIVVGIVLTLFLLLVLLPASLYIPVVQDLVCQAVVSYLNGTDEDLEYQVGRVRIGFPLQLKVENVTILKRRTGKTLVHVGLLQTGLDDIPINQPYFILNRLKVEDVAVGMDSLTQSFGMLGSLEHLDVERIEFDPLNYQVRIDQAVVDAPDLLLYVGPSVPDSVEEESKPWCVKVHLAAVKNGTISLDMNDESLSRALASVSTSPYFDYNHMKLVNVNIEAENIDYEPTQISADINEMRATEQNSGLSVKQLAAHFHMQDDDVAVRNLDLLLADNDYLKGDALLNLGMADSVRTGAVQVDLKAALDSANLIRLAAPYLPSLQPHWVNSQAIVEVNARLTPDSLDLRRLSLEMPDYVNVSIEGQGEAIFDDSLRSASATIKGFLRHSDFLVSAFYAEPCERAWHLPDSLGIDMEAAQRQQRLSTRVDMQMRGLDVLSADASYNIENEAYHVTANTWGLNVSDFMPSLIADGLTARVQADGRHFSFPGKYTRLEASMAIDSLTFCDPNGTRDRLEGLTANASLSGSKYVAEAHSYHPTLQLDTHLEGCFSRDSVSVRGYVNLPLANLARLPYGLAQPTLGTMGCRSEVNASYNWKDIASIDLRVDSLTYSHDDVDHRFADINVAVESTPGMLDLDLVGGDADVCIQMDHSINELTPVLDSLTVALNRCRQQMHFNLEEIRQQLPQMSIDFHMARQNPFYQVLQYETGYSFSSADVRVFNTGYLSMTGDVYNLQDQTGSIDMDTISLDFRPDRRLASVYDYSVHATHIDPRASRTYDIHADGRILPDSLTVGLTYVNGNYLTLYDLMASMAVADDSVTLHLEKDPVLYEQPFTVNKDNFFSIMQFRHPEERKLNTRARMLLNGPRDLKLNLYTRRAPGSDIGNQLLLLVRNLDIQYATNVMEWEGDAGGRFNMAAAVNLFPDSITARLRSGVRDFHLGDYHADTLAFDGLCELVGQRKDVDGTLTVDSIVKLQVNAALTDSINVRAHIDELPLPLVNAFLPTDMQLWGTTSGQLTLLGADLDHANVNAALTMQDAGLEYTDLDARLRFCDDTLRLSNNMLLLHDYNIYGANSNPVRINGLVDLSKNVSNPGIDLDISGDRVRIIDNHKLRLKDQYICGRLPITPKIRVKGTLAKMDVTGSLRVLSGTDLHYYMTDDPLQSSSRVDQLVDFVNFRQMDRRMSTGELKRRPPMQDMVDEGMDIGLKIEIDKDVKVAAHLEGTDNNRVDIVGGGSLNLGCDNEGNLIMNGTYNITSGKVDYKLPILPMVKTFDISNTSQVYWDDSDPADPVIDITATEDVKTTVNDDGGSRLVNFKVGINISGTLSALNMTFDCDAPDDGAISSDIASLDAEERSKAALMLLIAQTYIGPGNSSSMGLGTANAALNSMLNRQMDSMLGNMKGTNIDVGIDTYSTESGSTRTSYSVKVSQNLFNDRFRATIGGQINAGGDVGQSAGAQLGDMSLEWLIKKDGSHYLKVFRRTNYESVLEGELIETGVSYVQERSGYRFRQLLIPTSRKRQERMQQILRELQAKEEQEQHAGHEKDKKENE